MVGVLFVLTSCNQYIDGKTPTGWYLPEAAHPYYEVKDKVKVTFASPKGGKAPVDPSSVEAFKEDDLCKKFMDDQVAQQAVNNTLILSQLSSKDYDAVYYVGGAGPCMDLVEDKDSIALIEEFYASGKPTVAVCHAPITFINAKDRKTMKPLLEGREATAFSDVEEDQAGTGDLIPEKPEVALKRVGANYTKASEPWGVHLVVVKEAGGILMTGQNPASAGPLAKRMLEEFNL